MSVGAEINVSEQGEWLKDSPTDVDKVKLLSTYIWQKVLAEYREIEACNIPGGKVVALDSDSIRPVRPRSVPKF